MLTDRDRGTLERCIDHTKRTLPTIMSYIRTGPAKQKIPLKSEEDYALGMAHGFIISSFVHKYVATNYRFPTAEELNQGGEIVRNRSAELRNAIFESG
jgi:hypothetical protein